MLVSGTNAHRPSWRKDAKQVDDKGNTLMTVPYIKQLCKEQKLYQTPELNDRIYLHFKGFSKIENLDLYTGLRTLWLEGNDKNVEMRCLFLQQNCIEEIENLDTLVHLDTLNVSNNLIKKISNLSPLTQLKTLDIAHNYLKSADDIRELQHCPSLSIVNLSHNKLDDESIVDIFAQMPNLAVLNLMGNPAIRKIKNYRKTMISKIKSLTYLDDRPVFDNERLATEAWVLGGVDAEREERARQRQAEIDEHNRNFEALRRIQEQNIATRIQNQGGEDQEPVFSPSLERFRQEQLRKIEDHSDAVAVGYTEGADIPEIAKSAEVDVLAKNEDEHPPVVTLGSDNLLEDIEVDQDQSIMNAAPVRRFTGMNTAGQRIEIQDEQDGPLIQEIQDHVPVLEDATAEVEVLRERRQAIMEQVQNNIRVQEDIVEQELPPAIKSKTPKMSIQSGWGSSSVDASIMPHQASVDVDAADEVSKLEHKGKVDNSLLVMESLQEETEQEQKPGDYLSNIKKLIQVVKEEQ